MEAANKAARVERTIGEYSSVATRLMSRITAQEAWLKSRSKPWMTSSLMPMPSSAAYWLPMGMEARRDRPTMEAPIRAMASLESRTAPICWQKTSKRIPGIEQTLQNTKNSFRFR